MSDLFLPEHNITLPPTQADLPCDDGEPMETQRHKLQLDLLMEALLPWLEGRSDGFVGGNMFVYYSTEQVRNQDFKGPDFFVVLGVPKVERLSWVVWEEGKAPDVIIELLSSSTLDRDKNEKKQIYQNRMRVSEYYWFNPFDPDDWAGFVLQHGTYQSLAPQVQGQLMSEALGFSLIRWRGVYRGVDTIWLRWATPEGEPLPTPQEIAEQEQQRAAQEQQRAEREQQRAEREQQRAEREQQRAEQAEAQLRQTVVNLSGSGLSIAQIAQVTGLPNSQISEWIE